MDRTCADAPIAFSAHSRASGNPAEDRKFFRSQLGPRFRGDERPHSVESLSTSLPRAHDLDAVAGLERRIAPCRARHDRPIERNGDAALHGVDGFFNKQRVERREGQWLVLAVDADHGLSLLRHLPYSAARAGRNRSKPNGFIAGSTTSSRISRAMASAVTGASRMPLRWWPVA